MLAALPERAALLGEWEVEAQALLATFVPAAALLAEEEKMALLSLELVAKPPPEPPPPAAFADGGSDDEDDDDDDDVVDDGEREAPREATGAVGVDVPRALGALRPSA